MFIPVLKHPNTANTDALGHIKSLEAIRILKLNKKVKFYQALPQIFGNSKAPQNENTPFKLESLMEQQNFMHIGLQKIIEKLITYLHVMEFYLIIQSGETFVTRKITRAVAEIYLGKEKIFT